MRILNTNEYENLKTLYTFEVFKVDSEDVDNLNNLDVKVTEDKIYLISN